MFTDNDACTIAEESTQFTADCCWLEDNYDDLKKWHAGSWVARFSGATTFAETKWDLLRLLGSDMRRAAMVYIDPEPDPKIFIV